MSLVITTAEKTDLENILSLQKRCYKTEAELYCNVTIEPMIQTIASINEDYDKGILFLKGTFEGQIIGSVRGITRDGTTHIGKLFVTDKFHNQGYGKLLMQAIEQNLKECLRYELFTGYQSLKNINLYKKLGYQEFKREQVHPSLSFIFMEKKRF